MVKRKYRPEDLPKLLPKWAAGKITLKEIKGYTDEELFAISRIAYFFLMQGKDEPARVLFEGLIAIDPRNPYYYRALGVIFHRLGDEERALRQFTYALRLVPDATCAYLNRAEVFMARRQYARAASDLRKALQFAKPKDAVLARKARALYGVAMRRAAMEKPAADDKTAGA